MIDFLLTLFAVGVLFIVRTEIVFRHRFRAIDEIHEHNVAAIEAHRYEDQMEYNLGDPMLMILDLSKWTYKHFYPSLEAA